MAYWGFVMPLTVNVKAFEAWKVVLLIRSTRIPPCGFS